MRRLTLLLSVIAMAFAITATAGANATTTTVIDLTGTETFGLAQFACGSDFPEIDLYISGSIKEVDYYDNSGTLIKSVFTPFGGPITFTLVEPSTGKTATTQSVGAAGITIYNPDGSYAASDASHGVTYNFIVPGIGPILLSVGTLDYITGFVAGPHAILDNDTASFCSYFAP